MDTETKVRTYETRTRSSKQRLHFNIRKAPFLPFHMLKDIYIYQKTNYIRLKLLILNYAFYKWYIHF